MAEEVSSCIVDEPDGDPGRGRRIDDILLLASLAGGVASAVLAIEQADRSWRVGRHGRGPMPPLDARLFISVAAQGSAREFPDLLLALPGSPMTAPPSCLRWAYGTPLPHPDNATRAVVVLLDTWLRTVTAREQHALRTAARSISRILTDRPGRFAASPAVAARTRPSWSAVPISTPRQPPGRLLRSTEVAALFKVTDRTILNWAASGAIPCIRTIGGHLRFRQEDIEALLVTR